jgi:hypothetical protein
MEQEDSVSGNDEKNDAEDEDKVPATDATICLEKMASQRLTLGLFSHLFIRGCHPTMVCIDGPTGLKSAITTSITKLTAQRAFVEKPVFPKFVHDPFHLIRIALKQWDKLAGLRVGVRQPKLFPQLTLGVKAFFKTWITQKLLSEVFPTRDDVVWMLMSFPLDTILRSVNQTLKDAFAKTCNAIGSKALGSSRTMHTSVCESFNASFLGRHTSKREVYSACNYSARMKMAGLDWNKRPNWHANVLSALYKTMKWQ